MALCSQVVNLIRLYLIHNTDKAHGITQVSIMKMEMRLPFQMVNSVSSVYTGTANHPVNVVALSQQEFCEVGAVLTGDTCD